MKQQIFNKHIVYRDRSGQALLTSVVVIGSILLSIITIAGYLSIKRVQISRTIVGSGAAIAQADAGIERGLDVIFAQQYFINHPSETSITLTDTQNTTTINKISNPCTGYQIVARGYSVQGSVRAIELNLCQ